MTENEMLKIAVHCLGVQAEQEVCEECDIYGNCHTDCKYVAVVAIKALKEVQQYRKIGTVEKCREAVEKQKPEKPEIYTDTIQTISSSFNGDVYLCSRCGQFIGNIDDELPRYCNCCGQRIDEDLEGMEDE